MFRGLYVNTSNDSKSIQLKPTENYPGTTVAELAHHINTQVILNPVKDSARITAGDLSWLTPEEKELLANYLSSDSDTYSTTKWAEVAAAINIHMGSLDSNVELRDIMAIASGIVFRNSQLTSQEDVQNGLSLREGQYFSLDALIEKLLHL